MSRAKARPIPFQPEMARALWEGRKTQTRRIVKPQSLFDGKDAIVRRHPNQKGCPYGKPGDLLWVREAHHAYHWDRPRVVYRADHGGEPVRVRTQIESYEIGRWTPSIHMPRWASRMTLELTEVRVELVRDINGEDAKAEGVAPAFEDDFGVVHSQPRYRWGFRKLWQSINGPESWKADPWVWVLVFTVHKQNVDALPATHTGG